ncbi:MAG: AraC family transcriptional regulator [Steroidobacteraceae bacterium]|nr:AraC family transcriptional regulator [Steroidobacteraceae bacterium]
MTSLPLFENSTRIGVVRHLPAVLRAFGVELDDVLVATGLRSDIFSDPDNALEYPMLQRLLATCERLTQCDHIALLAARHSGLADFGVAGRAAACCATAGEGLTAFVDHFNLYIGASTVSLVTAGGYARLVYAIAARGITDARQFQLGAVAMEYNILRDLFGRRWRPTVVTFATRAPSNLRPYHSHFGAPLHFDSDESAVVFERHWLDRPLSPVDPAFRSQVAAELRDRQTALLANLPAAVRRVVRKRLVINESGMDEVAAAFGMHRRTLDRQLGKHGVRYGELVESVKEDMARQLLLDTEMQVQQVADALRFSSASNFATAFRRWTGMTPSEYRRRDVR